MEKIELRGCAGPPGRQYYLLLIAVVRVYAKMLKETENEETRLFGKIFVVVGISIEQTLAPQAHPLAAPMILR